MIYYENHNKCSVSVHAANDSNENEMFAIYEIRKWQKKRKKSESYVRNKSNNIGDLGEDSHDSDMSVSIVKLLHDFDAKLDPLHLSYLRKPIYLDDK